MNIYVPWVGTWPKDVLQAIDEGEYAGPVTELELDDDDPTDYWTALANLWYAKESFIIVEHDIVVADDTLKKLADCPRRWCGARYPYLNHPYWGLGCMKFGAELMEKLPQAMNQVGNMKTRRHPQRHWCAIDARLQNVLTSNDVELCKHGAVRDHRGHRGVSSHGCA